METDSSLYWVLYLFAQLILFASTDSAVISYGKQVSMSSIYQKYGWTANKAVDNNTNTNVFCGSCAHTLPDRSIRYATYQINLGAEFSISSVEIFNREAYVQRLGCSTSRNSVDIRPQQRFKGYRIYISDTSSYLTGNLCYSDNSNPYPDTYQNNTCIGRGAYITIYNNNKADHAISPTLELCEVRVHGCPVGFYGANCDGVCFNCINNYCNADTGSCEVGCKDGWWTGTTCNKKCNYTTYGYNCNKQCGDCFQSQACNKYNGICYGGCNQGKLPPLCHTECKNNTYGYNCSKQCGYCFQSQACNTINGICHGGCERGKLPPLCQTDCKPGTHGFNCAETCGHCKGGNENCSPVSGHCQFGCEAGWENSKCDNECRHNTYGYNCSRQCGYCFQSQACNTINGICNGGCNKGKLPPLCQTDCKPGTHGFNCTEICGHCKGGKENCSPVSGHCQIGCEAGWKNSKCDNVVQPKSDIGLTRIIGIGTGILLAVAAVNILVVFIVSRRKRQSREGMSIQQSFTGLKEKLEEHIYESLQTENNCDTQSNAGCEYYHTMHDSDDLSESSEEQVHITERLDDINDTTYYSNFPRQTQISVSEIRKITAEKKEGGVLNIEYKMLPHGSVKPQTIGEKTENKNKNRNRVFPYDHSIVHISKLDREENSDYINANYIKGVKGTPDYVATQGPRKNTVFAFWRMIWETKSDRIVMLSNVKELGKLKCFQYWREDNNTNLNVGHLKIILNMKKERSTYTHREFVLLNIQTKELRMIQHLHLKSWPDRGTPDPVQLATFHHIFTQTETKMDGPAIIHCSAGIGRTAVFIALDALMKTGLESEVIDVFGYVNSMRENRANMINTMEQYILLHDTLVEAFLLSDSYIPRSSFVDEWHGGIGKTDSKCQRRIKEEFKILTCVVPLISTSSKDEVTVREKETQSKKGEVNIFAGRSNKKCLLRDTYSNVIKLPTFHSKIGVIAAPFPSKEKVEDFWSMVRNQCSNVIVLLEPQIKPVMIFPSGNTKLICGSNILSENYPEIISNGISKKFITIADQGGEHAMDIVVFQEVQWSSTDTVANTRMIVDLIHQTIEHGQQKEGPVTVLSQDGTARCGIFALLYMSVEFLAETDEVNIFQSARLLQLQRPRIVPSFEEYESCYLAMCYHLEKLKQSSL